MPTALSRERQISLFLHFLECKLPACRPAQRRCCYPSARGGRCIHLHAIAQKTCACTVPGKEVSQSGRGPCRKENAKGNLKSALPLENPSQISKAPGAESSGTPELLPSGPAARQKEQNSPAQKCRSSGKRQKLKILEFLFE